MADVRGIDVLLGLHVLAVGTGVQTVFHSPGMALAVGAGVAVLSALVLATGATVLPAAPPRAVATGTAGVLVLAVIVDVALLWPSPVDEGLAASVALGLLPTVVFRLVMAGTDRMTDIDDVPLTAGLLGAVISAIWVPLLAAGEPGWSMWPVLGAAAGIGCVIGLIAGSMLARD